MNARNLVMKSCDSTNEIPYLLAFKNKNPPKRSSDCAYTRILYNGIGDSYIG